MASKYIRHGETYCGDGTTSAAAASNGGAGAWNDINVFEGSAPAYGTAPADGDVVYIRSKDNAGANITRTLAANAALGKSGLNASSNVGVRWIIDGGAIWSGINGTLTYRRTASGYTLTLRQQNTFVCQSDGGLSLSCEFASANNSAWVFVDPGVYTKNVKIDCNAVTYSSGGPTPITFNGQAVLENLDLRVGNKTLYFTINCGDYLRPVLVNPRIYLAAVQAGQPVFYLGSYGGRVAVYGGRIYGPGATTGQCLVQIAASAGSAEFYGTEIPKTMTTVLSPLSTAGAEQGVLGMALDKGVGSMMVRRFGAIDSRTVNNYPTLNATYPDSAATPWSWKLYPYNTTLTNQIELPFTKVFSDSAAAVTITVEMLVGQTFSGATKGTLWVDVFYTDDSTGEARFVSSSDVLASGAMDSSTAGWSATTWGSINCDKKKIAVTTPTSVKQNTAILILLRGTAKSASANDVIFIDPDPQLS